MVTNEIIETVAMVLGESYPTAAIYSNDVSQGLEPPAFQILALEAVFDPYPSGRVLKRQPLDVIYYPRDEGDNQDMLRVADELFPLLEFISCSRSDYKDKLHGTDMRCAIIDGALHFFVNYDTMFRRVDDIPCMETLAADVMPMSEMTIDASISENTTKEATNDA